MAVGPALALLSGLVLQSLECQGPQNAFPFLRLVSLYQHGHSEEAVQELAKLSPRFAERLVDHPWVSDRCLEAASLLETELAMTLAERDRWMGADRHFDVAWELTDRIEALADGKRFQRDWLLAVGLFYQQLIFSTDVVVVEDAFVGADRYLRSAVKLFPEDPEVLLAEGALLEWSGSLRRGDPAHLKEAEDLYSRALRLKPADPETLLRHGWVLEKLGRDEKASGPLRRVLELEAREDIVYRARMVLGRLAERGGRLTDSIGHYEAAANAIPSWQVAYIALGHALHDSGAHQRAREVLDGALAMNAKAADEVFGGWWSYELGISLRFEPLFERMRAEVRK